MMEHWYYTWAGLRVTSELPIPEWAAFEQRASRGEADVLITLDGEPTSAFSETFEVRIAPGEFHLHTPEAGDYSVYRGREIVVRPAPGAGAPEVRLFLLGTAWGALCYQHGVLALHASAVQVGDRAVAFCGESGSGKSCAAARLVARGGRLVGDDLCRFDVADGMARVHPSATRLKLWRDALDVMGWGEEPLERDHFRLDKFHLWPDRGTPLEAPAAHSRRLGQPRRAAPTRWAPTTLTDAAPGAKWPLPLGAIYLLGWGEVGLARLTGMAGLRRLIAAATYRPELLRPMGQVAAHWERCAKLALHVPVWELTRPRDWSAMDAAMSLVMERWRVGRCTVRLD